jgi:putative colanic acid biosynthesis glycosyltransferase
MFQINPSIKMKVININLYYKEGSTGKIIELIHKSLIRNNIESHICYAIGNHDEDRVFKFSSKACSKFYTYLSAITGKQYTYSFLETYRLINYIKNIKPDIVNIHAININVVNVYKLLNFLKQNKIKTVMTFHSEIFYTGGCSHALNCEKYISGCNKCPNLWEATHSLFFDYTSFFWKKFNELYTGFDTLYITSVSDWLRDRALKSPFLNNHQIKVIKNGVNESIFKYNRQLGFKRHYVTNDQKLILHVTPSFKSTIKGGKHVLDLASSLDQNKYIFLIIGYDANYELPKNVIALKSIKDQSELSKFYSIADITLLTSLVETFSMVCVESLCCGTPVVGFKCGAPEQICLSEYSSFVEYGDILALRNTIIDWCDKDFDKSCLSQKSVEVYSNNKMTNEYYKYYQEVVSLDKG